MKKQTNIPPPPTICISDCKSIADNPLEIKKGQTFITNKAEFNYSTGNETSCFNTKEDLIRLSINKKHIGVFKKINFIKIEDWRNNIIENKNIIQIW